MRLWSVSYLPTSVGRRTEVDEAEVAELELEIELEAPRSKSGSER